MKQNICLTDGSPVTEDHKEIDPETGMQKGYVVLTEEERSKGFIRPVRRSYIHVGRQPKYPLRPLDNDEKERYKEFKYIAFEAYPDSESPVCGRYWTQEDIDRQQGCGTRTIMGQALAETYARNPKFYSGTFCCGCKKHFPVGEFVWEEDGTKVGS